ncbi:unnamed protein product [Arabis nemorensis]|uniref:Uncharacterized protein n=1 Tax=Arabis nemorensis TaxID=586526 RepID=A0A565CC91_9BRAS|nr:unnamed protein product [Arabis nemorensis]
MPEGRAVVVPLNEQPPPHCLGQAFRLSILLRLSRLSYEIPLRVCKTLMRRFNRDIGGELGRVIPGILRDKFDGPYYSWKVTPRHVQERIFITFARLYHWDVGLTPTLWKRMNRYWKTPKAKDKSATASQCRKSDRGGLGIAKHVSGQKSYLRVQQEMCTQNDPKGVVFGLGELPLMVQTGKEKESFASSTALELSQIQDQL